MYDSQTIVSRLTPRGKSAIAVLGLAGADAWKIILGSLRPRGKAKLPPFAVAGSLFIGRMGDGAGDEVVVNVVSDNPTLVEVNPHGGVSVVEMLLNFLVSRGARLVDWQDYIKATAVDRIDALAQLTLNQCSLQGPTEVVLGQLNGAFKAWVDKWLITVRKGDLGLAKAALESMMCWKQLASHLIQPWKIVIAGKTNAGKSSLMNRIAGYQRSIVSPLEGTTRDVLWLQTAIHGWPFAFADTAGLRASSDRLETGGMELGKIAMADADLCLWVIDVTVPHCEMPAEIDPSKVLKVFNKMDLCHKPGNSESMGGLCVSAVSGMGLDELLEGVFEKLIPVRPALGDPFPFHSELVKNLESSFICLDNKLIDDLFLIWEPWLAGKN